MGTLIYNPERVMLREVVQQNIELHAHTAESKKITLVADVHPALGVIADHSMMDFIIRNLLSNAIKFTGYYGTVKVSANLEEDWVEIVVADTGVGMSPEVLTRIMEPESTFSTRGTQKEPGTGLGLLLVKEFLQKHGAQLHAESTQGKGTTFCFRMERDKETIVVKEVF